MKICCRRAFIPVFLLSFVSLLSPGCIISPPIADSEYVHTEPSIPEHTSRPPEQTMADIVSPDTGAVSWQNAYQHIGEIVTIFGPVVDSHWARSSNGKPTFLNIGKPYPDESRFTVLIWGDDRSKFVETPETMFLGKSVYVTGLVEEYNGSCEIIVESPSQITVK